MRWWRNCCGLGFVPGESASQQRWASGRVAGGFSPAAGGAAGNGQWMGNGTGNLERAAPAARARCQLRESAAAGWPEECLARRVTVTSNRPSGGRGRAGRHGPSFMDGLPSRLRVCTPVCRTSVVGLSGAGCGGNGDGTHKERTWNGRRNTRKRARAEGRHESESCSRLLPCQRAFAGCGLEGASCRCPIVSAIGSLRAWHRSEGRVIQNGSSPPHPLPQPSKD